MKLQTTRELFVYWERCRGKRRAPDRDDIDPAAIRRALGDTFILAFDRGAGHPFRLAGTKICALFGRELKSQPFLTLWGQASGQSIEDLTATIAGETVGAVASATGVTAEGDTMALELLMLPLGHRGRMPARLLGSLTPVEIPYWLGVQPLERLTLGAFRYVGPIIDTASPFVVAAPPAPRSRHGFVVHQGGRSE